MTDPRQYNPNPMPPEGMSFNMGAPDPNSTIIANKTLKRIKRRWLWVFPGLALGLAIGLASGPSKSEVPETLPTVAPSVLSTPPPAKNGPATQKPAAKTYMAQDGVYIVGENIVAGTYRAGSDAEFCVWQRYSDKEKTLSTKGTPIGSGPNQLMTVQKGDFSVEVQGCGPWVLVPVKR